MRTKLTFAIAVLTVTTLVAAAALAAGSRFNKVVDIGDAAPTWSNLAGTDGAQHSLADYKDAKVFVEVFTCNHCPVARMYEDRLIGLQKEYKDKGVQVVAISVSKQEGDQLPAMKKLADEKGFNFPYLHDPSQAAGRAIGATKTPHVFVFDADRKIVFMGGIDDNWMNPDEVKKTYLRDAIDAVLAGRTPEVQANLPTGCGIEY